MNFYVCPPLLHSVTPSSQDSWWIWLRRDHSPPSHRQSISPCSPQLAENASIFRLRFVANLANQVDCPATYPWLLKCFPIVTRIIDCWLLIVDLFCNTRLKNNFHSLFDTSPVKYSILTRYRHWRRNNVASNDPLIWKCIQENKQMKKRQINIIFIFLSTNFIYSTEQPVNSLLSLEEK